MIESSGLSPEPRNPAGTPFNPAGEFRGENGRVVYCVECRRMAVEYAGYRLLFLRDGLDDLTARLREALSEFGASVERDFLVGPRCGGNPIRLGRDQVSELVELMETAALIMDAEGGKRTLEI